MKLTLKNVTINASFLSVAVMSSVLILDTSGKIFMCFFSAFLHEMGHLLAMIGFSVKPKSITLRLFDIVIVADSDRAIISDIVITLSGPLMNFMSALAFYCYSHELFIINLFVGCFNLLPIETFDGGYVLKLMLSRKLSLSATRLILKTLTFIILVPMFFLGILVLFYSKYNYTLLMISLYLLAILFLK